MTEEQKQAAADRLAKARAEKAPAQYKHIHSSVLERADDDELHRKNVVKWIKSNKEKLSALRQAIKNKQPGAEAKSLIIKGYINQMESYLRTGAWNSLYWGEHMQHKIKYKPVKMAYYHEGPLKGEPKRSIGCIYPDIGEWTEEKDRTFWNNFYQK